jgi:hypothetical protein
MQFPRPTKERKAMKKKRKSPNTQDLDEKKIVFFLDCKNQIASSAANQKLPCLWDMYPPDMMI